MIADFRCKETELVCSGIVSRKLPQDIQNTALRKLRMLNNVKLLDFSEPMGLTQSGLARAIGGGAAAHRRD
jgi:proteic killer suppression protein